MHKILPSANSLLSTGVHRNNFVCHLHSSNLHQLSYVSNTQWHLILWSLILLPTTTPSSALTDLALLPSRLAVQTFAHHRYYHRCTDSDCLGISLQHFQLPTRIPTPPLTRTSQVLRTHTCYHNDYKLMSYTLLFYNYANNNYMPVLCLHPILWGGGGDILSATPIWASN